ncbi:peptidase inhibitor family I36 protein [Nocardia sp. CA-084685]|uniref:peptidase inhibitor family I36 protein n=1 Tax=Nocardia sp. CA-084685 TaxID=3239970 RepID=UPI003D95AD20
MASRQVAAAVLTVAGLAGIGAFAGPAQAATGYDRCPNGNFCAFTAPDGGGRIAYFRLGSTDLRLEGVDGQVYSVWNRTTEWWQGYTEYNYQGGAIFHVNSGFRGGNMTPSDAAQVHSLRRV